MAEGTIQKVQERLNCSICLDTYTDPKLLQCHHVYCRKCLVKLVTRDQDGQLIVTCPICRGDTPVPTNGVAGLQSAFHIAELLEIMEEHKKETDRSVSVGQVESDATTCSPHVKTTSCSTHKDMELELYCETCGKLVCTNCTTNDGKHRDHEHKLLSKAYEEPMEKQIATINASLAQLDMRCAEISVQRAAVESNIHDDFRQLHKILDDRKTHLVGQLHQITREKLKDLADQREQLEATLAQLSSCLNFVKESLKTTSDGEMVMKTIILKQVNELITIQVDNVLTPSTEADVIFSALSDVTAACKNYGQVSSSSLPDPSKCYLSFKSVDTLVGETSTAVLQAINYRGQPCKEPIKSLKCELVSEITGTITKGNIKRKEQSQYEICNQPTIKGKHQLLITAEGQHIKGSPFSLSVNLSVMKLGTTMLTIGWVGQPWGVAIGPRGEVLVTEWSRNCVSVFSPSGVKLRSFGTHGSGHGQFDNPTGIAVDGDGNILVVDCQNHRIQKYTIEGRFLTAVGARGKHPMKFEFPRGIVARNGKVYVVDCGNSRVQVLNSDLTFFGTFGKKSLGKPRGVACDSSGNVYVADTDKYRIQVFTAEGEFLRTFRRYSMSQLDSPADIAVDTNDMVYISECNGHRVSVFTTQGVFVNSFGKKGQGSQDFNTPVGITVDSSGVVYVCDHFNSRVLLF